MTMKFQYFIQMKCSILLNNNNNKICIFHWEGKKIQTVPAFFSIFQFSSQTDKLDVHIATFLILILLYSVLSFRA